jgi:hypothetical protein
MVKSSNWSKFETGQICQTGQKRAERERERSERAQRAQRDPCDVILSTFQKFSQIEDVGTDSDARDPYTSFALFRSTVA